MTIEIAADLALFNNFHSSLGIKHFSVTWDHKNDLDFAQKLVDHPLPTTLQKACEKRKIDFLMGRYCAIKAINKGHLNIQLSEDGSPIWPSSFVGSITHSENFALAAVAKNDKVSSLGLDCESILSPAKSLVIKNRIANSNEQLLVENLSFDQNILYTLVFSAKESIFKCLFPLVKKKFYFKDAEITNICLKDKKFTFKLLIDLSFDIKAGYTGEGFFTFDEIRLISFSAKI